MDDTTPSETKKCPYCAETILAEAIKCKHCKSDLSSSEDAENTPLPQQNHQQGAGSPVVSSVSPAQSSSSSGPIVGIVVLVAVGLLAFFVGKPMYEKQQARALGAKASEAIDNLDRIYKGAAVYFSTPHVDSYGERLPCQFPRSQGVTPIEGTCCGTFGGPDSDGDGACDNGSVDWDTPVWSALSFKMSEHHYFIYSFESSGTGPNATFSANAYADLDCDGVMSTFQRFGFGDPYSNSAECMLQGSAAFYTEKELE